MALSSLPLDQRPLAYVLTEARAALVAVDAAEPDEPLRRDDRARALARFEAVWRELERRSDLIEYVDRKRLGARG
ncbi:MAG: hypothetical protein M3401_06685 [Actinomycetota bacterium]|nr:hypothetical protein [Actinomycetota bacterium]